MGGRTRGEEEACLLAVIIHMSQHKEDACQAFRVGKGRTVASTLWLGLEWCVCVYVYTRVYIHAHIATEGNTDVGACVGDIHVHIHMCALHLCPLRGRNSREHAWLQIWVSNFPLKGPGFFGEIADPRVQAEKGQDDLGTPVLGSTQENADISEGHRRQTWDNLSITISNDSNGLYSKN